MDYFPPNQAKKAIFEAYLEKGIVFIRFDSRVPNLNIPKYLRGQSEILFQLGRDMAVPIPDLEVTESGIKATLSFSSAGIKQYLCWVPWEAVFDIERQGGSHSWPKPKPPARTLKSGKVIPPYLRVVK